MSNDIADVLTEVEELAAKADKLSLAEERLASLIGTIGDAELSIWAEDIRRTTSHFLPQRRKRLIAILEKRIAPPTPTSLTEVSSHAPSPGDVHELIVDFQDDLAELSLHHIFQWSTSYRDSLALHFERFLDAISGTTEIESVTGPVRDSLTAHSSDIFSKGFRYVTMQSGETTQYGITKSLNGLGRFLDLPIELYSTGLGVSGTGPLRLRTLTSSILFGILRGYAQVTFASQAGSRVLTRFPRSWAYSLAFLTAPDLSELLEALEAGDFGDGIRRSLLPLAGALDDLALRDSDYAPLPMLAQIFWEARRLDMSLAPPPQSSDLQPLEAQCFFDEAFVNRGWLEQAGHRGVSLVVAPIRADLLRTIEDSPVVSKILIQSDSDPATSRAREKIFAALDMSLYARRSPRASSQPLEYNFAREFPLDNPSLGRYFHVYRSSVRDLLRTFEQRNGVRLWCSVRRSGKTTACRDLASTTGLATIITQTCDNTGQIEGGSLFYDEVCKALETGSQLPTDFFGRTLQRAGELRERNNPRVVFVLDEYETLFGRLNSAARRDLELRYTVAQPLLNQMVEFAQSNLLVFLGQQPNAHFIFMDQNQLSPYVQQDSFPLFHHNSSTIHSEFGELVRLVLSKNVGVDPSFVSAIFEETSGHPFLTVNLLRELVGWLIDERRALGSLSLSESDFQAFSAARLTRQQISVSREYVFFRETIGDALSSESRTQTPWLHAVYSTLRRLAEHDAVTFRCSRSEFSDLVDSLRMSEFGINADDLLSTASQANFLSYDANWVQARIRLLARISAIARPRVV